MNQNTCNKDRDLENGINSITEAIELDKSEIYKEALDHYKSGIKSLLNAIKCNHISIRQKDIIKDKCRQYLDRAMSIKDKLEKNQGAYVIDDAQQKVTDMLESVIWCTPSVKFDDIIGLEDVKEKLKEGIILRARYPQLFTRGFGHHRYLLFGPPGTGKTLMAQAVGTETGYKCLFVSAVKLLSPYHDPERLLKGLFKRAREIKPVVIFIDEIDALSPNPDCESSERTRRVRTELLVQMEGIGLGNDGIQILAATNCPQTIIPAFRRRFSQRLYFPLPNQQERSKMAEKYLTDNQIHHCLHEKELCIIGEKTEGFTCYDISQLIQYSLVQLHHETYASLYFRKISSEEYQDIAKIRTRDSAEDNTQQCTDVGGDVDTNEYNTEGDVIQQCPKTEGNAIHSIEDTDTISNDETTTITKDRNILGPVKSDDNSTIDIGEQDAISMNSQGIELSDRRSKPQESDALLGNTHDLGYRYIPCSPDTEGAVKLNPSDIKDKMLLPPLTLDCVLNSLTKVKPTYDQRIIDGNLQFKKDFVDMN